MPLGTARLLDRAPHRGRARLAALPAALPPRVRLRARAAPAGGRRTDWPRSSRPTRCASCARPTVALEADEGTAVAELTLARGERASFVLSVGKPGPRLGRGRGRASRSSETVEFWRAWIGQSTLSRALARDRRPLGDHAQAAHVPADRRGRRGTHDEPARAHRRAAQLGLPLLLAARLGVHDVRVPAPRLPRGGVQPTWRGCTSAATSVHERRAAAGHVRASTGAATCRGASSRTSPATATRSPCASATARPISSSSTSTARSSTPSTSPSAAGCRSPTRSGSSCARSSTGWRTTGISRTRASGRCAAAGATSPTRGS